MSEKHTHKQTKGAPTDLAEEKLKRTQATWVSNWLTGSMNKQVPGGWMGVYDMTPSEVAEKYEVGYEDVLEAAKGNKR